MDDKIKSRDNKIFYVKAIQEADIEAIKKLSDITLGVNYYSEDDLFSIIHSENKFFCKLLYEDEIVGFNYHYIKTCQKIAMDFHCSEADMCEMTGSTSTSLAGVIKSVGIKPDYRANGLAYQLNQYALYSLSLHSISSVWAPAWVKGDYIPEHNTLLRLGFSYYRHVSQLWYNKENLFCPACEKEHCICDAAIYYRLPVSHIA